MLRRATLRDFTGLHKVDEKSEKETTKNIVIAYNIFVSRLKKLSEK